MKYTKDLMSNIGGIINVYNPRNKVSGVSVSDIEDEKQFYSQVEFGDTDETKTQHSAEPLTLIESIVWPYHLIGDQEYEIIVFSLWDTSNQLIASFKVKKNPEGEGYRSELPQLGDNYITHVNIHEPNGEIDSFAEETTPEQEFVQETESENTSASNEFKKRNPDFWYLLPPGRKKEGPFTLDELKAYFADNEIDPGLKIRNASRSDWCALVNVKSEYPDFPDDFKVNIRMRGTAGTKTRKKHDRISKEDLPAVGRLKSFYEKHNKVHKAKQAQGCMPGCKGCLVSIVLTFGAMMLGGGLTILLGLQEEDPEGVLLILGLPLIAALAGFFSTKNYYKGKAEENHQKKVKELEKEFFRFKKAEPEFVKKYFNNAADLMKRQEVSRVLQNLAPEKYTGFGMLDTMPADAEKKVSQQCSSCGTSLTQAWKCHKCGQQFCESCKGAKKGGSELSQQHMQGLGNVMMLDLTGDKDKPTCPSCGTVLDQVTFKASSSEKQPESLEQYAQQIASMVTCTIPCEPSGLYDKQGKIKKIGSEINEHYGFEGMQNVWKMVNAAKGHTATSELTRIWHGIGRWQA